MSTHKIIYWREDTKSDSDKKCFSNVHMLVGYNPRRLSDYQEMLKEMQKTFPEANETNVECGFVTKSMSVQAFTLLMFNARLKRKDYQGWDVRNQCEYNY